MISLSHLEKNLDNLNFIISESWIITLVCRTFALDLSLFNLSSYKLWISEINFVLMKLFFLNDREKIFDLLLNLFYVSITKLKHGRII